MTRQTFTKRVMRKFELGKNAEGGPALIPRDSLQPPAKPIKHMIKCGLFDVEILVSPGQIINERKICKRFLKQKAKDNNLNYKSLKRVPRTPEGSHLPPQ